MPNSIFSSAWNILNIASPTEKVVATYRVVEQFVDLDSKFLVTNLDVQKLEIPGRPDKPILVQPRELPRRKLNSLEGRVSLLHAICHIEFNAINLAWDAIYRFRDMPVQYYLDWMKISKEEAEHFSLLNDYITELGFAYGDFAAHNGLWDMAVETDHDVLIRMALVPRVLEARGLDVTPGIMKKFESVNDVRANEILTVIQREEIGHVEIGSHWFKYCCEQQAVEPDETFRKLLKKYLKSGIKKPVNYEARLKAGFTQQELDYLENDM